MKSAEVLRIYSKMIGFSCTTSVAKNTNLKGFLKIIKTSKANTTKRIEGAVYVLKNETTGKYVKLESEKDKNNSYVVSWNDDNTKQNETKDKKDSNKLTTDKNGIIKVSGLDTRYKYTLEEIEAPDGYSLAENIENITVKSYAKDGEYKMEYLMQAFIDLFDGTKKDEIVYALTGEKKAGNYKANDETCLVHEIMLSGEYKVDGFKYKDLIQYLKDKNTDKLKEYIKGVYNRYKDKEEDVDSAYIEQYLEKTRGYAARVSLEEPDGLGILTIIKVDADSDKTLKGAVFRLRDADGKYVKVKKLEDGSYEVSEDSNTTDMTTNDKGEIKVKGLKTDQKYDIIEITPPEGYALKDQEISGCEVSIETIDGKKALVVKGVKVSILDEDNPKKYYEEKVINVLKNITDGYNNQYKALTGKTGNNSFKIDKLFDTSNNDSKNVITNLKTDLGNDPISVLQDPINNKDAITKWIANILNRVENSSKNTSNTGKTLTYYYRMCGYKTVRIKNTSGGDGSLKIKKVDATTNEAVSGINFKIYSVTEKKWIKLKATTNTDIGTETYKTYKFDGYVDSEGEANIITSQTNGTVALIEGLPLSDKYEIYEYIPKEYQDKYKYSTEVPGTSGEQKNVAKWGPYDASSEKPTEVKETVIKNGDGGDDDGGDDDDGSGDGYLRIKKVDSNNHEIVIKDDDGNITANYSFKIYEKGKGWLKLTTKDGRNWSFEGYGTTIDDATPIPILDTEPYIINGLSLDAEFDIYEIIPEGLEEFTTPENITVPGSTEKVKCKKGSNSVTATPSDQTADPVITTFENPNGTTTQKHKYDVSGYVWLENGSFENKTEMTRNDKLDSNDAKFKGITVNLCTSEGVETSCVTNDYGYYEFKDIAEDDLSKYHIEFIYDGLLHQCVLAEQGGWAESSNGEEIGRTEYNNSFEELTGNGQQMSLNGQQITLNYNKNNQGEVAISDGNTCSINGNTAYYNGTFNNNYKIIAKTKTLSEYKDHEETGSPNKKIPNINLGLYEREKGDISLAKDLNSVKLSVNGFSHIYKYGNKTKEYYDSENASLGNVSVQFAKEKGISSYTRQIYKSDKEYETIDKSKELKAYITYEISMGNETTNLVEEVKSLVDYFDARYLSRTSPTIQGGKIVDSSSGDILIEVGDANNQEDLGTPFNITSIEDAGDNYKKIVIETNTQVESGKMKRIFVRFKLSREQVKDIIDSKDPLDNEVEVNSYKTLKDGATYATIDVDSIPANATPGEANEDDEDKAPALHLVLEENRTMSGIVFEDSEGLSEQTRPGQERIGDGIYSEASENRISGVKVTMVEVNKDGTDKDGITYEMNSNTTSENFKIANYIPGYYVIKYEWGQNQGGIDLDDYKGTIYKDEVHQNMDWYKTTSPRYSDAKDDWNTRLEIDATTEPDKIKDMTMISTTPVFGVGVDEEGSTVAEITSTSDGNRFVRQDSESMDFGIVERPRQSLEIKKVVDNIKIQDEYGQTLFETAVEGEGDARKFANTDVKHGVYNPKSSVSPFGQIKYETDQYPLNIKVEYKITVANKSELDYKTEGYYLYGTDKNNIVKLKPSGVFDYLKGLTLSEEDSETIRKLSYGEYNVAYEGESVTDKEYASRTSKTVDENGNEIQSSEWWSEGSSISRIYYEWYSNTAKEIKSKKTLGKEVLKLENDLVKEISPLDPPSETKLHGQTVVTSTKDEIKLQNDVEIINVEKANGYGRTPDEDYSQVYDRGEEVIVTPPTGANRNFTVIIITSIFAVAVLGIGIILIKKKVLNK